MKITVMLNEVTIDMEDNTPPQRYAVVDWQNHPPVVSWTTFDHDRGQYKDSEFVVTADVVPIRDVTERETGA